MLRHAVELDAGASAVFIEQHASNNAIAAHANTVTGLTLGEGASATWVIAAGRRRRDASRPAGM
ncbi:MAG: hypothetical protein R3D29_14365 [Nitratireductor sp.]